MVKKVYPIKGENGWHVCRVANSVHVDGNSQRVFEFHKCSLIRKIDAIFFNNSRNGRETGQLVGSVARFFKTYLGRVHVYSPAFQSKSSGKQSPV